MTFKYATKYGSSVKSATTYILTILQSKFEGGMSRCHYAAIIAKAPFVPRTCALKNKGCDYAIMLCRRKLQSNSYGKFIFYTGSCFYLLDYVGISFMPPA